MPNEVKLLPCEDELVEQLREWLKATADLAQCPGVDPAAFMDLVGKGAAGLHDELATRPTTVVTDEVVERVIAEVRKVRDGYVSQMKFCDIEAMGYFREFVRRLDAAITAMPSVDGVGVPVTSGASIHVRQPRG